MRGDRLREIRENLGMSQESLGDILGSNQKQIWRWENGKTVPNGDDIVRLATALNITTDYLLGVSDDPTPANLSVVKLSAKERQVISYWRQSDRATAARIILNDE